MNLEARRVIDQVRSARTPSADDKERIRKALAIGVVAAMASAPATAAGATVAAGKAAGAAGIASGLKIAVTVAVVASLGAGTYWLTRSAPAQRPALATVAPAPVAAPPVAAEPVPPPTVEPTPIVPAAAPASSGRPGRDPLMAELSLLHKAQQAWRQGKAARALALAQQHARRYPHSVLGMERDALRVFALCALGQTAQARPLAGEILKRAPGSPLRTSVEESCGGR
ncbi:MAG TPA: hypothetical protein VH374_19280 [Polyangia bacterium]|jgi:hypothetical protein|nr:hypothetical protein [Polyangia bacterium]